MKKMVINKYEFKDIILKKNGFLRGPFGGDLKKEIFVPKNTNTYKVYEQGVVLNSNKNIGKYYISEKDYNQKLHKFSVKNNDFLVSCSGVNMGAIYQLKEPFEQGIINQALLCIRLNNEIVNDDYFYYLFKKLISKRIITGTGDSTIPNFPSLQVIKKVEIDLPDIKTQEKIASVLSTLDKKIEINNRINEELEAMSKTLYDYWFVQFEFPNEEGKPYKSSGGKMIWNEELKREIPEGWEVQRLEKLMRVIRGASPRPIEDYLSNKGISWIKISDVTSTNNRFVIETKQFIINEGVSKSRLLKSDTLILSNSATPAIPKIVKINSCVHDGWLIIDSYKKGLTQEFMFHYFEYERPRIICLGNGSIFKNLKTEYVKDLKIVIPKKEVLEKLTPRLKKISEQIYICSKENKKLEELRDWLLPMLMNGQVSVN